MPASGDDTRDPFDLCGQTLGEKYRISAVIGRGGFGVVYRGVHTGFGEPIAIKCLKIDEDLDDEAREQLLAKLQDEGRVLHRLSKRTSGIVQALDVGATTTPKGRWVPYLVLEWLEGQTLADLLAARRDAGEAPYPLGEAVSLLEPAARALAVAHRLGVAHRDVKPENLMVTDAEGEATVKVLDFGIAKVLTHSDFTAAPAATQNKASAFTPSYGAPEQFNKKRGASGPWTDVFALALILVEATTGRRALEGDDATQLYIAAADPASRPTPRYAGVDTTDAVEKVFRKALAIEPSDRFQDADAFWDALLEALDATPPPPSGRASDTSVTGDFMTRHNLDIDGADASLEGAAVGDLHDPVDDAAAPHADEVTTAREPRMLSTPLPPAADDPGSDERPPPSFDDLEDEAPPAPRSGLLIGVAFVALALAGALSLKMRDDGPAGPVLVGSGRPGPTATPAASAAFTASARPPASGLPTARPSAVASPDAGALVDAGATPKGTGGGGSGGAPATPHEGGGTASASVTPAPPPPPPTAPPGMVLIESPPSDAGARTRFFLDKQEVSVRDYRACVAAGRCVAARRIVLPEVFARIISGGDDSVTPEQLATMWGPRCNDARGELDHPVNCVNHGSAEDYCRWKSRRLPSAAEWEAAASGFGARRYPWGNTPPKCGTACYALNGTCVGKASAVASCVIGSRTGDRTPEGLVDMGGNVAEWVSDRGKRPTPRAEPLAVLRGGSFVDEAPRVVVTTRLDVPRVTAHVSIGFRCAKSAD